MSCRDRNQKRSAAGGRGLYGAPASSMFNLSEARDGTETEPALYFEIPVNDMTRAMAFYATVFGFDFELEEIHGNQMALMPFAVDGSGISGALAKGEIYKPTVNGTLIYLHTASIDNTLNAAQLAGAKVLFPKTKAGDHAYVAEIEDSEGNRIGLMEPLE